MKILKSQLHTTQEAGSALKFELFKACRQVLMDERFPGAEALDWVMIRAIGKKILKRESALDHECAEAIIMRHHNRNMHRRKKGKKHGRRA